MHPAPRVRRGPTGDLRQSDGLTLIEVLVCFMLLSLLAAAVFPVVTQRVARGEPVRAHDDLASIAVALERFAADLDGQVPADLGDLVAPLDSADRALLASGQRVRYPATAAGAWRGPYLPRQEGQGVGWTTGYGVPVRPALVAFDARANRPAGTAGFGSMIADVHAAVELGSAGRPLTRAQFEAINDLVDGTGEPDGSAPGGSWSTGRLRYGSFRVASDTVAYFLAARLPL